MDKNKIRLAEGCETETAALKPNTFLPRYISRYISIYT